MFVCILMHVRNVIACNGFFGNHKSIPDRKSIRWQKVKAGIAHKCGLGGSISETSAMHDARVIHFPTVKLYTKSFIYGEIFSHMIFLYALVKLKPWVYFHNISDTRFNVEFLWHEALRDLEEQMAKDNFRGHQRLLSAVYKGASRCAVACSELIGV